MRHKQAMSANALPRTDIRRSGRATKGQHTKLEAAEAATPKNKKGTATAASSKKNTGKKSAEPEPEAEVDDEEAADEVIRCVCGDTKDDEVGRQYVSCDTCEVWQHNVCMGVPLEEERQPEHYFCELCEPNDHKDLLEAEARGEQLWQTRIADHEAEKRRKRNEKKRPKSRQQKAARQSEVKSEAPASEQASPAPTASIPPPSQDEAPAAGSKRKFEEETVQQEQDEEHAQVETHAEATRRSSSAATQSKRRKSEQKKEDKVDTDTALVDVKDLPKERQTPALALVKVFGDVVRERVTTG
jgi:hypothetical protein